MVFQYYADSDMLYIRLADGISTNSEEVAPDIVLDFGDDDQVIGIEIEDASNHVDLAKLEVASLPIVDLVMRRHVEVAAEL